jgi:hypothetical protein
MGRRYESWINPTSRSLQRGAVAVRRWPGVVSFGVRLIAAGKTGLPVPVIYDWQFCR